MPGAGSGAGSTSRRPRGTARWRRRQKRAPPPLPGRGAHRNAGGRARRKGRAPGRGAGQPGAGARFRPRMEVPGRGEGLARRGPAADIPSTPIIYSRSSPPSAAPRSSILPTFEFEVCGRVEDQDLLVLRHGPRGGRHRRDSAERGRARGGGGGWLGTMAATTQPSSTMESAHGSRTPTPAAMWPVAGQPAGSAARGLTTDSTPHQPPGHAHCDPQGPT